MKNRIFNKKDIKRKDRLAKELKRQGYKKKDIQKKEVLQKELRKKANRKKELQGKTDHSDKKKNELRKSGITRQRFDMSERGNVIPAAARKEHEKKAIAKKGAVRTFGRGDRRLKKTSAMVWLIILNLKATM